MFENWNRLPQETKYHCLKMLDFKSRCNARMAGRVEKHLIDSIPIKLQSVLMFHDTIGITVFVEEPKCVESEFIFSGTNMVTDVNEFVIFLFKNCTSVNRLTIDDLPDPVINSSWFGSALNAKWITLIDCSNNQIAKLAKNCNQSVIEVFEVLQIKREQLHVTSIIHILGSHALINLHQSDNTSVVCEVTNYFLNFEAPIGRKIIISTKSDGLLEEFDKTFENRVEKKSGNSVRLVSNDLRSHLVLIKEEQQINEYQFFILAVIPSEIEHGEEGEHVNYKEELLSPSDIS